MYDEKLPMSGGLEPETPPRMERMLTAMAQSHQFSSVHCLFHIIQYIFTVLQLQKNYIITISKVSVTTGVHQTNNVSVNSKPDHPPGRPPGIHTF